MVGLIASALGIRLSALSIETGKIIRTATMPQSRTCTYFGAFFRQNLRIRTASTIQPADMLRLTMFRKSSHMTILPSDTVNHLLYFVEFGIG